MCIKVDILILKRIICRFVEGVGRVEDDGVIGVVVAQPATLLHV